ncbi:uncharacterized protein [Branchiostoma lanceolatum]|uniref:uncharacterized protein isoform X1 n=1 Tax=Branchiostoma lanceolatum TaxID=7740 RepID=UPI00345668A4
MGYQKKDATAAAKGANTVEEAIDWLDQNIKDPDCRKSEITTDPRVNYDLSMKRNSSSHPVKRRRKTRNRGTTDVREVTLVKAVSTLDGKVPTQTAPGQKCCGCSKVPVCSSSNCNCRKAGKVCGTKCKCAKKHLDCKNKNSVEVQNNCSTAVPRSSLAHSWRKVDL